MSNLMAISSLLTQYTWPKGWEFMQSIIDVLDTALWPILILIGSAGAIYAVVLGVRVAKADTPEQREEAKKKVINTVIALVVVIALILLLKLFVQFLPNWLGASPVTPTE